MPRIQQEDWKFKVGLGSTVNQKQDPDTNNPETLFQEKNNLFSSKDQSDGANQFLNDKELEEDSHNTTRSIRRGRKTRLVQKRPLCAGTLW